MHEDKDNLCFTYSGEEIVIFSNCMQRGAYNVRHVQQYLMEGPFDIPTLDEKVWLFLVNVQGRPGVVTFNPKLVFVFAEQPPSYYVRDPEEAEDYEESVHAMYDLACFLCACDVYTSKGIDIDENWITTSYFYDKSMQPEDSEIPATCEYHKKVLESKKDYIAQYMFENGGDVSL